MANILIVLAAISSIIFIGFFAELIFKKTKIPDVIFLIAIGIIMGQSGLVDAKNFGFGATIFTTFTLLFLLFQGALSIDFKTLYVSFKGTVLLTAVSFLLTALAATGVSMTLLGFDFLTGLLLGAILGGTSSAVVIPLVKNLQIKQEFKSILMLESAISDVLCIVGTITIISVIGAVQYLQAKSPNPSYQSFQSQ